MINSFVATWNSYKHKVESTFKNEHPEDYKDVVKAVIQMLHDHDEGNSWEKPDPNRIHEINDGDYQGTLVYIIGATGYQPDQYWSVKVSYGSCSGCDTLQSIRNYEDDKPSKEQVEQYMALALHIIQGLHTID